MSRKLTWHMRMFQQHMLESHHIVLNAEGCEQ